MSEPIYDCDLAQALDDPEAMAAFLVDALDTGDAAYIARAMGVVARAKGMTKLARETGLAREQFYKPFSERGNPILKTILVVMNARVVALTARAHAQQRG
jgi:probable addiction module antidote protein